MKRERQTVPTQESLAPKRRTTAVPAKGLEGMREEEEATRRGDKLEVRVGEGPAGLGEVLGCEDCDADTEHRRRDVERDPALAGPAQIDEPSHVLHHRRLTQRSQPAKGYEWVTESR
jgi:hypothetical protein